MKRTPFERAVDRVIAEENRRFLNDPEAQRLARETGDRWARGIETGTTSACPECGALVGEICEHRGHESC